jgi:ubiquinone/menaquinone biosynthesis C-methylase UbiE
MNKQDFEVYAKQKSMVRGISSVYEESFKRHITDTFQPEHRILDFGCGDGAYFEFFLRYYSPDNVFGTDVSQERVNRCQKKGFIKAQKIAPGQSLPFPDNYFSFINCDQVIEHILKQETDFYLQEMRRVLKPGGKALFITPNYPIKHIYDFLSALRQGDLRKMKDDPTHVTKYNFFRTKETLGKFFLTHCYPTGGRLHKILGLDLFSHKIMAIATKK